VTDVRVAAARVLLGVDRQGATLGGALDDARARVAPADRGLIVELATGVLRWRNELDAVIASAARRSVREIEPDILTVLRLGTYQLRHLDRVPAHAVVHASVESVRTLGHKSGAGLVNAVLRSIIRRGPAIGLPARPADGAAIDAQIRYLSTTMSHPAWLVRRWIERYGFDAAETWCRFNNAAPEVTVRSLDGRAAGEVIDELRAAGIAAEPAPFVSDAVRLAPGVLGDIPPLVRDRLWVQDEASQLVARMAAVVPGERVLDVCAAPGGKTMVLADDLQCGRLDDTAATGALIAADHRAGRVTLLCETLVRAHRHVPVVRLDARVGLPFGAIFDCVLLDAPCSGLGTLRREPDLKWTRNAADLPALAAAQLAMLRTSAESVRPGGRLVYATCSSEPEEDVQVVDAFLAADPRFTSARPEGRVPAELLDDRGHLTTRPDVHGLEAFYAAVLVRREGT
jgi:16S rRNA (cytosine967-C5)-methyltransferase